MKSTYEIAARWFEYLRSGRFSELFTLMDDNIHWVNSRLVPGVNDAIPWIGTYQGKLAVKRTFDLVAKFTRAEEFSLDEIFVDGDIALTRAFETQTVLATGREYRVDVMFRMRVRDGRVVEWQALWDTAEAVAAFRDIRGAGSLDHAPFAEILSLYRKGIAVGAATPVLAARWENGMTLLHLACGYGCPGLVRELLAAGADVNAVDRHGGAEPIHKACQGGHVAIVAELLDAGAFINSAVRTTGHTPVMEAAWYKMADCAEYLIARGAALNTVTSYGFTLDDHLAYALKVNQKPADLEIFRRIKRLVEERRKSDNEATEKTAVLRAVLDNNVPRARLALEAGENADSLFPVRNSFEDGHTPLLVAARENQLEMTRLLLESGADVNHAEPCFGAVPLHKAAYNGHAGILRELLSRREANVSAVGWTNGYTPLHDALWHGFEECSDMLIDAGSDLRIRGHDGKTPLDIARGVFGNDAALTMKIREKNECRRGGRA